MTLASPRYEVPPSKIMLKSFIKELAEKWRLLHKSPDFPPRPKHEFCLRVQVADFPKSATFNGFTLTQDLKSPLGEGEDGLGRHLVPPPPPHQGILLFMYRRPTLYPLEIAVDFLKSP